MFRAVRRGKEAKKQQAALGGGAKAALPRPEEKVFITPMHRPSVSVNARWTSCLPVFQ